MLRGLVIAAFIMLVWGCRDETLVGLEAHDQSRLHSVRGEIHPIVLGVWSEPGGPVWFAGGARGPGGGFIAALRSGAIRYEQAVRGATLWWIWGGSAGLFSAGEEGRVLRLVGTQWREEYKAADPRTVFWGGWTCPAGVTWLVGGSQGARGPKGLIIRRDQMGVWSSVDSEVNVNLFKVWGQDTADVYFVGERGVALHWNGDRLRRMSTGTEELLFTVHGSSDGHVYAVGGNTNALVLRLNDDEFVDDGLAEGLPVLNGVYSFGSGRALAVGQRGLILERSAGEWRRLAQPQNTGIEGMTIHAVSGSDGVWFVGGDISAGRGGVILTDERSDIEAFLDRRDVGTEQSMADRGVGRGDDLDAGIVRDSQNVVDALSPELGVPMDAEGDGGLPQDVGMLADRLELDQAAPDLSLAQCGDGQIDEMEECDDGNRLGRDGCDSECRLECGNGAPEPGEECDDGGRDPGDGCSADCRLECGDGVTGPEEECDDGDRVDGDGCDSRCRVEMGAAGVGCANIDCQIPLECLGVAIADFYPVCTGRCDDDADCEALDFIEPTRCDLIGPQLIDTYCVPERCYEGRCEEG